MKVSPSLNMLTLSRKRLTSAEHMAYLTLPLTQEKRILIKILYEMRESVLFLMCAVLSQTLKNGGATVKEEEKIFSLFRKKCSAEFMITQTELEILKSVLVLYRKHTESPFEFVRKDSFIILSDELETEIISMSHVRNCLAILESIFEKIIEKMARRSKESAVKERYK